MKSIILLIALMVSALCFWGCPSAPTINILGPEVEKPLPENGYLSFAEVSQPYLEQYGEPEKIYEYADTNEFCYVEYWWDSQGFMVCFVQTASDDYSWSVYHNSEWITLEEVLQPYLDLYGAYYDYNGKTGVNPSMFYNWRWDDEMLTAAFYEDDDVNWKFAYEKWWSLSESTALIQYYLDTYGELLSSANGSAVVPYFLNYKYYVECRWWASGLIVTFWGISSVGGKWYCWEVVENRN